MTMHGTDAGAVEIEIPVAWGEMDAYGHVNNIVYLRWFESCRMAYFRRSGVIDRVEGEGIGPILARTTIATPSATRIAFAPPPRSRDWATARSRWPIAC